jgi:mannose-6-phosphate isomerase-like protein (cupin superfamily)
MADLELARGEYVFSLRTVAPDRPLLLEELKAYSVFVLDGAGTDLVATVGPERLAPKPGSCLQIRNQVTRISSSSGSARLLIAGVTTSSDTSSSARLLESGSIKKVTKPWGHELWLHEPSREFAFKEISIRQGTKTSLQYHRQKRETNVLFDGEAILHFLEGHVPGRPIADDVATRGGIARVGLLPISAIDVPAGTLHRLEAASDLLLYEVSTPHLDDVVRIQDDTQRRDGRIDSEHG